MCGVCGKVFDLASSLSHHMYTHNERRFFCEKCSFHCHFESELKKHNISHHSQPSHQCMRRNCGRWFKRKSDLVLHVETHKKDILECDSCDFTTTLQKYLKEHKKSHDDILHTRAISVTNDSFGDPDYERTKSRNILTKNLKLLLYFIWRTNIFYLSYIDLCIYALCSIWHIVLL